jgi:hypothetical protein
MTIHCLHPLHCWDASMASWFLHQKCHFTSMPSCWVECFVCFTLDAKVAHFTSLASASKSFPKHHKKMHHSPWFLKEVARHNQSSYVDIGVENAQLWWHNDTILFAIFLSKLQWSLAFNIGNILWLNQSLVCTVTIKKGTPQYNHNLLPESTSCIIEMLQWHLA